ncbi:sensor histidine kinase [Actinorhabdospora filicis]|nr:sensor histidine kinase [Actinorhabdospora filicis]
MDERPIFRRLAPGALLAIDGALAVGYFLALATFPMTAGTAAQPLRIALAAGIALPVALRRRYPRTVLAVVAAASIAAAVAGLLREPFLAAALAAYTVALQQPRHRREPTLAIAVVSALTLVCGTMAGGGGPDIGLVVVGAAVTGAAWTVGRAVRERRMWVARSAAQAVTEERLRIARELHDVVAHGMGVIAVKAGVAAHVLDARPEEAREALKAIAAESRAALTELRSMLGVLRSGDEDPLTPAPGLAELAGLPGRAGPAGVRVTLDVRVPGEPPAGVATAAYRIAQEAVTNAVKHAAPTSCLVRVTGDGESLQVEVTDAGPGRRVPPPPAGGHGLIGMRERAAAHGGTFDAGPLPGGGFRVRARLPFERSPA